MSLRRGVALNLVVVLWTINLAVAETPLDAVRRLVAIRNSAIDGAKTDDRELQRTMSRTLESIRTAPADAWRRRLNRDAATIYVLLGGAVSRGVATHEGGDVSESEKQAFRAAAAASAGRADEAGKLLKTLDARAFGGLLGGLLALAQARYESDDGGLEKVGRLELARLLAPGTLIEETALRGEIYHFAAKADVRAVSGLFRRYELRYSKSIFAARLRDRIREMVVEGWLGIDDVRRDELVGLIESWPAQVRVEILLTVARKALLSGDVKACLKAVDRLGDLAPDDGGSHTRAALYRSAASMFSAAPDDAVRSLESLKSNDMSPDDRALLEASLSSARWIRREATDAGAPGDGDQSEAMQSAQAALGSVDRVLAGDH